MKISQLEILINENIKRIPEVPLSFLLSGGIDCSLILALLRKNYPELPITTFCLAKSKDYPDIIFAREIADLFNTEHNEIIKYNNEYSNWHILLKYAKKFSNIVVTGDGGDECFGGYWLHKYPLGHKETGDIKVFSEIHSVPREHLSEMFDMGFRDFLFRRKSRKNDYNSVWEYYIKTIYIKQIDPLMHIANKLDVKIYSPLFSKKIVDFMRDVPYQERINKKIFRELALKYLPESIINREKLALSKV